MLSVSEMLERVERGELIPVPRGWCAVCLASVRLRQDGTCGTHQHWLYTCGGTGHLPTDEPDA